MIGLRWHHELCRCMTRPVTLYLVLPSHLRQALARGAHTPEPCLSPTGASAMHHLGNIKCLPRAASTRSPCRQSTAFPRLQTLGQHARMSAISLKRVLRLCRRKSADGSWLLAVKGLFGDDQLNFGFARTQRVGPAPRSHLTGTGLDPNFAWSDSR
jgi:hypothetical protein